MRPIDKDAGAGRKHKTASGRRDKRNLLRNTPRLSSYSYRGAGRFHIPQWASSIESKVHVLDSIYEKLAARAAAARLELLEIIIIILIAVSTAMPFVLTP